MRITTKESKLCTKVGVMFDVDAISGTVANEELAFHNYPLYITKVMQKTIVITTIEMQISEIYSFIIILIGLR